VTIYVIGHLNPDTDAIASALGYAWLLRARDQAPALAARAGPVNPQTTWVLRRLGMDAPELLSDASPRCEAIARRLDTVAPDSRLREAWLIANRTGSVAPVVDAESKPFGLITGLSLFAFLSNLVGTRAEQQQMKLADIFDLPCEQAADTDVPRFQANARIRDMLPRILREGRDDFWVVSESGAYVGVCRRQDLLNPPRLQLILLDHNEVGQALASVDEADLLEVLDHHRLGNPPTRLPIRFRVDTVGSTSTLVAERIEESGLSAPPDLAGLLLACLLSDTLQLTSPTTTDRDRRAADRLGRWTFIGGSPLAGESRDSFGQQLLLAGAGLATRDPSDVVTSDLKLYQTAGLHFGIAQVEVTDLVEVNEQLPALSRALDGLRDQRALDFAMLMVTDIVAGASRILMTDAPPVLDDLPYHRMPDDSLEAPGLVSRKKQLLPAVLALLEG
jgi:manganese-dependent inorganic pyrophosphatase